MEEKKKHAGGRPTKYKPIYGDMLVDHMAQGYSFESFAGVIGTHDDTLRNWAAKHEEFFVARKDGYAKNRIFWERMGVAGMTGHIDGFNSSVWIFNMKNRFKWADRIESEQNISGNVSIVPTVVFKSDAD